MCVSVHAFMRVSVLTLFNYKCYCQARKEQERHLSLIGCVLLDWDNYIFAN